MTGRSVVLVTGVSRGIGRHVASGLASRGWAVIGCGRSARGPADGGVEYIAADVSVETDVKRLLDEVRGRHGRLDAVVNNAGIASMNHSLLTPAEAVDSIMGTNFKGTFLVLREAAKLMRRRKHGRIVNLTSIAVPLRLEGEAIYAASKAAVETVTRIASLELAPFGITVNAIGPGPIPTDLVKNVPRARLEALLARTATRAYGTPEQVLDLIAFLLRPESGYLTGQVIYLGGVS